MNLTISICGSILLTSMTGSAFLLVWLVCSKMMDYSGSYRSRYKAILASGCLFVLPVTAVIVHILAVNYIRWGGYLFLGTPRLYEASLWFMRVWAAGVIAAAGIHVLRYVLLSARYRQCFPCDRETRKQMEEIRVAMPRRQRRVSIYSSYQVSGPLLWGIRKAKILLPANRHYDYEELRVIICHELTHHRQKTNLVKMLALIAAVLNWYNPLAWLMTGLILKWWEIVCDEEAAERLENRKLYFEKVKELIEKDGDYRDMMGSALGQKGCSMRERTKRAAQMQKKRKIPFLAIIASIVMATTATVSVMAATDELARLYIHLRELTYVGYEVDLPVLPEVYTSMELPEGVKVRIEGDTIGETRGGTDINWTVPNNVHSTSGKTYLSAGSNVSVVGNILPSNKTVKVGIENDVIEYKYAYVSNYVFTYFTVETGGYYRFFVENTSGTTIVTDLTVVTN